MVRGLEGVSVLMVLTRAAARVGWAVGFVAAVVGVGLAVGLVVGVLGEVARFAPPTLANGKVGARADVAVGATWGGWDGGGGRVRVWSLVGWWAGWFV
jgi:hypothetical protein